MNNVFFLSEKLNPILMKVFFSDLSRCGLDGALHHAVHLQYACCVIHHGALKFIPDSEADSHYMVLFTGLVFWLLPTGSEPPPAPKPHSTLLSLVFSELEKNPLKVEPRLQGIRLKLVSDGVGVNAFRAFIVEAGKSFHIFV